MKKMLTHAARAERRKAVLLRLREGASVEETAAAFGFSTTYIRMIASAGSVKTAPRFVRTEKRKAQLREFCFLGSSQSDFVRLTGMPASQVSLYARMMGLTLVRSAAGWEPAVRASKERAAKMVALYKAGYTLQQIGTSLGISRERVRQLMTKHFGIRQKDGGKAKLGAINAERRLNAKNARYFAKYGCSFTDLAAVRSEYGRKPTYAFQQQRRNARERGIGWEFSFWSWWCIWRDSGHWAQRGRGQGYVMCRHGDVGPYAAGNVYIATASENSSAAQSKRRKDPSLPTGVKRTDGGRFAAHRSVNGEKKYLGVYDTPELAHAAYLMAAPTQGAAA